MTSSTLAPRIGLLSVRFKLFDAQMGPDFVARMHAHAERSASILEGSFDVVRTPLIEDEPLCNPAVAPAEWPISHRGSYAQGSSPFAGPAAGATVTSAHLDLPSAGIPVIMSSPWMICMVVVSGCLIMCVSVPRV